jgi:PAS domain S-box-containing protein
MAQNKEQENSLRNFEIQKLLKENEALRKELRNALWASNSATWKWNCLTNHFEFNEHKATSIGFDKSELGPGNEAFTDLLHPDDYEFVMQAMRDLVSGKSEVYDVVYRIKSKEGTYRWFHDKGHVTSYQDNGEPLWLEGAAIDITQEKELRADLEKSKDQFETFFNSNPSATFVWKKVGEDFILDTVNEAAIEVTKNTALNYIGETADKIYQHAPIVIQKLKECFDQKEIIKIEANYRSKSTGNYEWIEYKLVSGR